MWRDGWVLWTTLRGFVHIAQQQAGINWEYGENLDFFKKSAGSPVARRRFMLYCACLSALKKMEEDEKKKFAGILQSFAQSRSGGPGAAAPMEEGGGTAAFHD